MDGLYLNTTERALVVSCHQNRPFQALDLTHESTPIFLARLETQNPDAKRNSTRVLLASHRQPQGKSLPNACRRLQSQMEDE